MDADIFKDNHRQRAWCTVKCLVTNENCCYFKRRLCAHIASHWAYRCKGVAHCPKKTISMSCGQYPRFGCHSNYNNKIFIAQRKRLLWNRNTHEFHNQTGTESFLNERTTNLSVVPVHADLHDDVTRWSVFNTNSFAAIFVKAFSPSWRFLDV